MKKKKEEDKEEETTEKASYARYVYGRVFAGAQGLVELGRERRLGPGRAGAQRGLGFGRGGASALRRGARRGAGHGRGFLARILQHFRQLTLQNYQFFSKNTHPQTDGIYEFIRMGP